jgi:hypothetical protein
VIEVDDHLAKVEIDDFDHAADGSGKKQPKANVKYEEQSPIYGGLTQSWKRYDRKT